MVLDGELVARTGRLEDFCRLRGALHQKQSGAVTFAPFDLVWLDGSLTGTRYERRRELLEELAFRRPGLVQGPALVGGG